MSGSMTSFSLCFLMKLLMIFTCCGEAMSPVFTQSIWKCWEQAWSWSERACSLRGFRERTCLGFWAVAAVMADRPMVSK